MFKYNTNHDTYFELTAIGTYVKLKKKSSGLKEKLKKNFLRSHNSVGSKI